MSSIKLVCCLHVIIFVFFHFTEGIRNSRMSSLSSRKQLHETQNVKTIEAKHGDVYDCIDFYEQPAFKHSKLQNHKFHPEMRPNFVPNFTTTRNNVKKSSIYTLENGGCPRGTVPIRRLGEEDRAREALFSKTHAYNLNEGPSAPPGTHFAIIQTKTSPNPPKYYGVGAYLSIWNPQVKENQYSAAQITVKNGPDSIQAGWMVNPTMYKDDKTHLFIHTNAGESHCYNTYCSGFVIVRSDIPPDVPLTPYSSRGKKHSYISLFIFRDTAFGVWWLSVLPELIPIGFWPEEIFGSLKKYGTYISCGGETYSPPNQPGEYPPMGAGGYPIVGHSAEEAGVTHFETATAELKRISVDGTEEFMDTKKCYQVYDKGITKGSGHVLFFGGHGRKK